MTESQSEIERSILLAGLPGTGKTTYLALLYLVIARDRARSIRLGRYDDDRHYLGEISKRLLSCQEALHTEVEERREMSLSLTSDALDMRLRIPDLSGEKWEQVLLDRRWDADFDEVVRKANGVMLFLHVAEFDSGPSIAAADAASTALGQPSTSEVRAKPKPRVRAPAQVELVDILQLVVEERGNRPARVSLVLSAWDLVPPGVLPSDWLVKNAPLANQFLKSNEPWLRYRLWGVSAQGGSFKGASREAMAKLDAVDRSRIVSQDGSEALADDPILWTLEEEGPR